MKAACQPGRRMPPHRILSATRELTPCRSMRFNPGKLYRRSNQIGRTKKVDERESVRRARNALLRDLGFKASAASSISSLSAGLPATPQGRLHEKDTSTLFERTFDSDRHASTSVPPFVLHLSISQGCPTSALEPSTCRQNHFQAHAAPSDIGRTYDHRLMNTSHLKNGCH